jgi:SAM-dependent methyltransferase
MPDERYWESLFNIPAIVHWLDVPLVAGPIVEIGSGYGTFTIPIARATDHVVYGFDIEPTMVETVRRRAAEEDLGNVVPDMRDVLACGTGLPSGCAGLVLLFNILHFDDRRILLEEASRILKNPGRVSIIHWRKDIPTPRGPDVDLRPDPDIILKTVRGLGLGPYGSPAILEPYHWGMHLQKKGDE